AGLDLPAGPLSQAIAALAERYGVSIGAADSRLLAIPLPPLHLRGSPAEMLARIDRVAKVSAVRLAPGVWRIVRLPPVPRPITPPSPVMTTIIVEASKRRERLEDDPVEIVSLRGSDLGRYALSPDTGALSGLVPILISTDWGAGRNKLFLRGIADSSFTGSSPALVGEYLGDQRLTYSAPDPDLRLYDVSRVEVLAGPQGTLYGAGSLGGLIRIEPNSPLPGQFGGAGWLGLSATAHGGVGGDFGGVINVPLAGDRLALRAVGYAASDAGYIDDPGRGLKNINRTRTRGGRLALRWAMGDGWSVDLIGVAQRIDNRDAPYADPDGPPLTHFSMIAQPSYNLFLSGSVVVAGHIGGLSVRSTTGIVHQSLGERFAALRPGAIINLFDEREHPSLLSQETRISGASDHANWVLGAAYLSNINSEARDYGRPDGPTPIARLRERMREFTVYGQVTRRLVGPLSATIGGRYAHDRLSGETFDNAMPFIRLLAPNIRAVSTEHHLVPSVSLSYAMSGGAIVFLRYETGFRPGGLTIASTAQRYAGDHIATTELGVRRGASGDDRFAFSLTAAISRWHDIQADILDGIGMPKIANIGDGRVDSLDATCDVRIMQGLRLGLAGFVARSRLSPTEDLAAGGDATTLPNVAKNGGTVTLDYRHDDSRNRSWQAGVRVQHVGPSVLGVGPALARRQSDYTTMALDAGVQILGTELSLGITNLLDSRKYVFAVGTPFAALIERDVTPLRPRTVRLALGYKF
ncbi:MAG TPA: TonB-dependent receptor, partial [Acetobacteraceae bacterium]|nr:TonB-dependent receptor [Acetobacteraceae bacterium]